MKSDVCTRITLIAVAALLATIALRPLASPSPAYARADSGHELYIEPGTTLLRAPDGSQQALGKVVIDMSTGKVWGFPTLTEKPYPVDTVHTTPPVSRPIYLGQFDFSAITD